MSLASNLTCALEAETRPVQVSTSRSKDKDQDNEKDAITVRLSESHSPSINDTEKAAPELDEDDIPDGGFTAWLTVFGAYVPLILVLAAQRLIILNIAVFWSRWCAGKAGTPQAIFTSLTIMSKICSCVRRLRR